MTEKESIIDPDFRALADETLDLWQDYIDSFAADPKARAEMAQMFQPLGQMMAPWTEMMQKGMEKATPDAMQKMMQETMSRFAGTQDNVASTDTTQPQEVKTEEESKYASSAEIERRMAEFESRLGQLESFLAKVMAHAASSSKAG